MMSWKVSKSGDLSHQPAGNVLSQQRMLRHDYEQSRVHSRTYNILQMFKSICRNVLV